MKSVIVVDDFYENPLRVREAALKSIYTDVRELNYPGYQSDLSFSSKSVRAAFSAILNEELDIDSERLTFGRFRLMNADSTSRLKIHLDGGADWTALVYLNLPEQCKGGTAFYRHRATRLTSLPSIEAAHSWGYDSIENFEASIINPDTLNTEAWDVTMFVAMRFNRLLLFRGNRFFHSHTCSWGHGKDDGRLTQNFFFNSFANGS